MGEYRRLARSVATATGDIMRGRVHQPTDYVGHRLTFADGTTTRVYRETTVDMDADDPAVLLVAFRLRRVRDPRWHAAFRRESWLNTVLFVGFPGFVSKLWCAHDERHTYRGLYQWDGAQRAEQYVASLRHVLAIVSDPRSIDHVVIPNVRRDDLLAGEVREVEAHPCASDDEGWWRLVDVVPTPTAARGRPSTARDLRP